MPLMNMTQISGVPKHKVGFSAYEEFNYGGPVQEISAGLINKMSGFPTADVIFKDGYDKIINLLAKNLQIQTNSIVKSVNYRVLIILQFLLHPKIMNVTM